MVKNKINKDFVIAFFEKMDPFLRGKVKYRHPYGARKKKLKVRLEQMALLLPRVEKVGKKKETYIGSWLYRDQGGAPHAKVCTNNDKEIFSLVK